MDTKKWNQRWWDRAEKVVTVMVTPILTLVLVIITICIATQQVSTVVTHNAVELLQKNIKELSDIESNWTNNPTGVNLISYYNRVELLLRSIEFYNLPRKLEKPIYGYTTQLVCDNVIVSDNSPEDFELLKKHYPGIAEPLIDGRIVCPNISLGNE